MEKNTGFENKKKKFISLVIGWLYLLLRYVLFFIKIIVEFMSCF